MTREDLRGLVEGAARETLPDLIGDLEAAKARALVRLMSPTPVAVAARPDAAADVNISVEEAARRLGISDRWIYKNAKSRKVGSAIRPALPFIRRIGDRRVVCSARGVAEWNAGRRP